ncbi:MULTISPECIES: TetR/AcrR family transcriptional regulator [Streptomyces]|nr:MULTISPECIES: TetR/AcrR family transcriptional regulator [Streptomyces]
MMLESPTLPPARDRRVRRSRAVLMAAAVTLVSERGTADVPVAEIADTADVSRRLVYQQFHDRETLLLEAALDLARRELLPRITEDWSSEGAVSAKALALAEHMASHRRFYRALYTSPCGFALSKALNSLFLPVNRQAVCDTYGRQIDERTTEDIAAFLTGGWGDFIRAWVVEDPDPLDPHEFTSRLVHIASMVLRRAHRHPQPSREQTMATEVQRGTSAAT